MPSRYAVPLPLVVRLALAVLCRQRRSFRADARACIAALPSPLQVEGREHVPAAGPCVLTVNHYTRPGFGAWWLALAISSVVPAEVHWTMASAWTYPDWLRAHTLTPAMRWLLGRLAHVYGFTTMPPMPPSPAEVAERAQAVRRVLTWARQTPQPVLGLAPEGQDTPGSALQWPAPGSGRFILQLAQLGLCMVPVGMYEAEGRLCLRFGPAYALCLPPGLAPAERDRQAAGQVMRQIAAVLPASLRGAFA